MEQNTSEINTGTPEKDSLLLMRLVFMFQTAAMQQMGKIADPINGKIDKDLAEASVSIDTLIMIRKKCKNNLSEDEERFLNHVIYELQLNYVDEINRKDKQPGAGDKQATDKETEPGPTDSKND
jgi:hypothetical protein